MTTLSVIIVSLGVTFTANFKTFEQCKSVRSQLIVATKSLSGIEFRQCRRKR